MHWTRRVSLLCLAMLPLCFTKPAAAQNPGVPGPGGAGSGVVYLDDVSGSMALTEDGASYLLFQKMVGDSVGIDDGYSRIGLRLKLFENYGDHLFGELHTLISDRGQVGFHAGGGYRWLVGAGVFGVNGWYDNTESSNDFRYEQATIGAEFLHTALDLRTNLYLPFGERDNAIGLIDPGSDPVFVDNTLGTIGTYLRERSFRAWDFEGGTQFPYVHWLRMYAGGYMLDHDDDDTTWGVRARAEARVAQGVNLNFMVTDDDYFGTNLNLDVEIRFDGRNLPTRFGSDYSAIARRYDQVRRTWPVQTQVVRDSVFIPLLDPTTQNPYGIAWVDNTADPGGDGSYDRPFDALPGTINGADLILVRRGVGGTDGMIDLLSGQSLLGEGKEHTIITDRLGAIDLAALGFSDTGPYPTLIGNGGVDPVIRLANNTFVSAFNFDGVTNAISGTNVSNVFVESINGVNVTNGINIQNGNGTNPIGIRDINLALAAGGTGIRVTNTTAPGLGVALSNIDVSGGAVGALLHADGAGMLFDIDGLRVNGQTSTGLHLEADNARLEGLAENVVSNGGAGTGVVVDLDNATGIVEFRELLSSNHGVDGMRVRAVNGTDFDLAIIGASMTTSALNNNADDNLQLDVLGGAKLDVFVDPTSLSNAGNHGIEFTSTGAGSELRLGLEDVVMNGNGTTNGDAVNGNVTNAGAAWLSFVRVDANGSTTGNGLDLSASGANSRIIGSFDDTSFSNNELANITASATNNGRIELLASDLTADRSQTESGLIFNAASGGQITSQWIGGSISNNQEHGYLALTDGVNSSIVSDQGNVVIDNNDLDGVHYEATGGSNLSLIVAGDLGSISGNGDNGIDGFVSGANSTAQLGIGPVDIRNSGSDGVRVQADNGGYAGIGILNVAEAGVISDNGGAGISLLAQNASEIVMDSLGARVQSNDAEGLSFDILTGSSLKLRSFGGNYSSNGRAAPSSGVRGTVDGPGSEAIFSFGDTSVNGSSLDGFNILATNDAHLIAEFGEVSASNNAGSGLIVDATGANTTAYVVMTQQNSFSNNGVDGARLTADGISEFAAQVSGNFNNNGTNSVDGVQGDGLHISSLNVGTTAIEMDISFGNTNTFNGNEGDGVELTLGNTTLADIGPFDTLTQTGVVVQALALNQPQASDNGRFGVSIEFDGATITDGGLSNLTSNDNAGGGLRLAFTNGSVLNGFALQNITTNNNGGLGLELAIDDSTLNDLIITGNTATGNGGDGIVLTGTNASTIDNVIVFQNTISNNSGNGFTIDLDQNSTLTNALITNQTLLNNGGAGVAIQLEDASATNVVFDNVIVNRTTSGLSGIVFNTTNSDFEGQISNSSFTGAASNANMSFGVGGEILGGTFDLDILGNQFVTNAGAGIGFIFGESDTRPAPGTGTPLMGEAAEAALVIIGNTITGTLDRNDPRFTGSGISLQLNGTEMDTGVPPVDPTTTVQPAAALEAFIASNVIGNSTNAALGNAGSGIEILVNGDTALADLASLPGTTLDDAGLNGIHIGAGDYDLDGNGVIGANESFLGNLIANNQEDGIRVRRRDSAIIDNFVINANIIENNREDGIDLAVQNSGQQFGVSDVLDFTISGNRIAGNGSTSDDVEGVAGRGIQLRASNAAILEVNISENLIDGNRLSGIEARTFKDTHNVGRVEDSDSLGDGDDGVIYGMWNLNRITNNGFLANEDPNLRWAGHGIALGRIDMVDPDSIASNGESISRLEGFNNGGYLMDTDDDGIGDTPALLAIEDNEISGNALDGVHVYLDKSVYVFSNDIGDFRTSNIDINRNTISRNGEDGLNIHSSSAGMAIVNAHNNAITGNGVFSGQRTFTQDGDNTVAIIGDGIEIVTGFGGQLEFNATQNRIRENNGRGVNILTAGKASTLLGSSEGYLNATFDSNNISANAREGFYVVNAPLENQVASLIIPPPAAGAAYSGYTSASWLADFDSNHELFNYGRQQQAMAAGNTPPAKVLPFLDDDDTDFHSPRSAPVTDLTFTNNIVNNNGSVQPDADPDDIPPYSTLGGFVLRVGSATEDFNAAAPFTESVISTLNFGNLTFPEVGGVRARVENNQMSGNVGRDVLIDGFIATDPPNVTTFNDPLIRIDLVFNNNRGNSLAVDFYAAYENTSPTSPGGDNQVSPDPPFDADRRRDATRNVGSYPGLGTRTLRVDLLGADFNIYGAAIGNNQFNNLYSDFTAWQIMPDDFFGPGFPP